MSPVADHDPRGVGAGFAAALRTRRLARGLTQEELAGRAGIHRTYLSDIERGSRNVGLLNIGKIAEALNVPVSRLFQIAEEE